MTHIRRTSDEAAFLDRYDPAAFDRPSLAIDIVLLTVTDATLKVLLNRRDAYPDKDRWALPGGFVAIDEGLDAAAARVLAAKTGLHGIHLEQLYTFGAVARDPRMRVVSVAYIALLPADQLAAAGSTVSASTLATLDVSAREATASVDGVPLALAFDHAAMLALAVERLRGKLDYAPIAFALLPARFTLRGLQDVHEAIRGQRVNKPAFRRRMLDTGWLAATGERETGTSYRPAELHRYRPPEERP